MGNYNSDYVDSAFALEGYMDMYNVSTADLKDNTLKAIVDKRGNGCVAGSDSKDRYEFVFIPNFGFLSSKDLLVKDCEVKLSFDRTSPTIPILQKETVDAITELEIQDCMLIAEYSSSSLLRSRFTIDNPITYEYEDIEVLVKKLDSASTNIRLDNIRGGNVPSYIFIGVIPSKNLQGDFTTSATQFEQNNVDEMSIMLNGNVVNGYPIRVDSGSPVFPMYKFFETTNRLCNVNCGSVTKFQEFRSNWIWAHKFEAEGSQGWISLNLKLKEAYEDTKPMSMVIWLITSASLTIDKFHQIEKQ